MGEVNWLAEAARRTHQRLTGLLKPPKPPSPQAAPPSSSERPHKDASCTSSLHPAQRSPQSQPTTSPESQKKTGWTQGRANLSTSTHFQSSCRVITTNQSGGIVTARTYRIACSLTTLGCLIFLLTGTAFVPFFFPSFVWRVNSANSRRQLPESKFLPTRERCPKCARHCSHHHLFSHRSSAPAFLYPIQRDPRPSLRSR